MNGIIILLAVLGSAIVIALISFVIYRYTHPKLKEEKPDEKEILQEEMDRILKPIEDDEVAKKVEEYKEEDE